MNPCESLRAIQERFKKQYLQFRQEADIRLLGFQSFAKKVANGSIWEFPMPAMTASEIMARWVPGYPNEWTWGEELCDSAARPAIEAIKHSLQGGGQLQPVLLSNSGYVLDGHRRIMAAYELDDCLVPYEIDADA